jgi:hAT family C-terminal dimerisation region
MSSSVSSERAFSQGSITISKRRNRLKGDIVEALQCIKCAIRHDLLFREAAPSSALELNEDEDEAAEEVDDENEGEEDFETGEVGWDDLLIEEDEEDAMTGGGIDSD